MLNLIDEHTRESPLVRPERRWSSAKVIEALADVMVMKGVPEYIRSDNGPEFVARDLRKWPAATGANTLYIEPGSPWENGYCESFNSKLRGRVLERGDLLLVEGGTGFGRALACPLQHRQTTLLAGLSTTSPGSVAPRNQNGVWRSGKQSALRSKQIVANHPDDSRNLVGWMGIRYVKGEVFLPQPKAEVKIGERHAK
jgi:transposase InsO family protein